MAGLLGLVIGTAFAAALMWGRYAARSASLVTERDLLRARVGDLEASLSEDSETAALLLPLRDTLGRVERQVGTLERDRVEQFGSLRAVLARVEACVDAWLQDDVVDIDAQRTGGMLELSFPNGSKIVLNTQPPLHEIWLAARAGGYHYKFVDGAWRDTRDGRELFDVLSACAGEQAGQALLG